jgi:hypothetical protein
VCRSSTRPAVVTRPTVIVKVPELVETPLQFLRSVALLFGNLAAWHIATPTEVRLGIRLPRWASKAAPEPLIGVSLNLRNTRIDLAVRAFALDVAAAITLVEPK